MYVAFQTSEPRKDRTMSRMLNMTGITKLETAIQKRVRMREKYESTMRRGVRARPSIK